MAKKRGHILLSFVIYTLWSAGWIIYYFVSDLPYDEKEDLRVIIATVCMLPLVMYYPVKWLRRYFKDKI